MNKDKIIRILGGLLVLSVLLNVSLSVMNINLQSRLDQVTQTTAAQGAILETFTKRKLERVQVFEELRNRNKHVPGIILANWATDIQNASITQRIPVKVLMNLYRVESAFVHYDTRGFITVSNKNAGGLGQVMPFWYKACPYSSKPEDLDNASVNIQCSAFILRHYLDENDDDMFLALTAYNAGPNGVRLMKRGRDVTQGYAKKILQGMA